MILKPGKTKPTILDPIEARATRGRRLKRVPKNLDGTSRFRGPGLGKATYGPDGKNPARGSNGRIG